MRRGTKEFPTLRFVTQSLFFVLSSIPPPPLRGESPPCGSSALSKKRDRLCRICWTFGRGSAAFGQVVAAATPRLLNSGTDLSCRWDAAGDSHRWIMAKPSLDYG